MFLFRILLTFSIFKKINVQFIFIFYKVHVYFIWWFFYLEGIKGCLCTLHSIWYLFFVVDSAKILTFLNTPWNKFSYQQNASLNIKNSMINEKYTSHISNKIWNFVYKNDDFHKFNLINMYKSPSQFRTYLSLQ